MKPRLPRITVTRELILYSDGEAEGRMLVVEWLGMVLEIAFARRVRTID